jgi:hypothetical protein
MYDPHPLHSPRASSHIRRRRTSPSLERPDLFTVDRPFLNGQQARRSKKLGFGGPDRWRKPRFALWWWKARSLPRWIITLTLCIVTIIAVSLLLKYGNSNLKKDFPPVLRPYNISFGAYNSAATIKIFKTTFTSPTAK